MMNFAGPAGPPSSSASPSTAVTTSSLPSKSLGVEAFVRAQLYWVHGGEAQIKSTGPCSSVQASALSSRTSHVHVASAWGSESTEVTFQPRAAKARPTEPVPEKSSRR